MILELYKIPPKKVQPDTPFQWDPVACGDWRRMWRRMWMLGWNSWCTAVRTWRVDGSWWSGRVAKRVADIQRGFLHMWHFIPFILFGMIGCWMRKRFERMSWQILTVSCGGVTLAPWEARQMKRSCRITIFMFTLLHCVEKQCCRVTVSIWNEICLQGGRCFSAWTTWVIGNVALLSTELVLRHLWPCDCLLLKRRKLRVGPSPFHIHHAAAGPSLLPAD